MEPPGPGPEPGLEPFQLSQDIHHLITLPLETSTSFTALLQLPPTHAMELLHSPALLSPPSQPDYLDPNFISPANRSLIDRPVKSEPNEAESCLNSTKPLVSDPIVEKKGPNWKRKEREHDSKVKGASKKSKSVAKGNSEEGQVLPYVHVRARRGQATDSHSLAERARREKINAKMKLLQELVPGCNKISGTALILDEIINHVQSLQQQVEILSMRLAAVNMAVDFNLDSILSAEGKSLADGNFHNMAMPVTWPDAQVNSYTPQHRPQWFLNTDHHPSWESKEGTLNFVAPENSLLSYNNSANTDTLHLNLKQS